MLVQNARQKLSELQDKLKEVSKCHQLERKNLSSTHLRLSQDQDLAGKEKLKAQVMSLSSRHKTLLNLFTIQKDIGVRVVELEKQVARDKGKNNGKEVFLSVSVIA